MKEPYSILIPAAGKDYHKVPYLLDSIHTCLSGYSEILLVVRDKNTLPSFLLDKGLKIFDDEEILDVDMTPCRYRPNWIRQQLIKMFQDVTENDLFLTIDSDVIINRKLPMFTDEGKKILYMGWEQLHYPYFRFQEKMLDLPREYPHTFVNDMNFMSKKIIREMLDRNGFTIQSFIQKSFEVMDGPQGGKDALYMAEPEIWGQYAMKYHADDYEPRQCKTHSEGRVGHSLDSSQWSKVDIETKMEQMKTKDYDCYMNHDWTILPGDNTI